MQKKDGVVIMKCHENPDFSDHKLYGPFLDVGFNFIVNVNRVTSIIPMLGLKAKRLYLEKRDAGLIIDATRGRKKQCLIVLDTGEVVACAFRPKTIIDRQF